MRNLLNGTDLATVFLDTDLGVKRFTASASRIIHLVASDIGRPISNFATNLKYDRLVEDAKEVLETIRKNPERPVEIYTMDNRRFHQVHGAE